MTNTILLSRLLGGLIIPPQQLTQLLARCLFTLLTEHLVTH
jgi:hypothetical protein